MRKIAIIGAGQAGLLLGIMLLKNHYRVSLFTNRTSQEILSGRILSTQAMYHSALAIERSYGLNFWDDLCPWNQSFTSTVIDPKTHQTLLQWQAKTNYPFQAIDQRMKFARWQEEFQSLGGHLVIQDVGLSELDLISKEYELTVVAAGKGEISHAFTKDERRSVFDKPQRALAAFYVSPTKINGSPGMRAHILPELGEYTTLSGLTLKGRCEILLFEAIPNGPMDCWRGVTDPNDQLNLAKHLLQQYLPTETEHRQNIKLIDDQATLTGALTPIVRKPILTLPSGNFVLGMADTVVLNDPISGQGANNATKCAAIYLASILNHQKNHFDEDWMQQTFESYWQQCAQAATDWTNLILAPPHHFLNFINASAQNSAVATLVANAFDDPKTLFPWILDPAQTQSMLNKLQK